jgi:ABC-type nickel/cobalt efflux system permease component RcnA
MNDISLATLLLVSFGLGLKHATEPDHLAAVSTIVSDRRNIWSASLVGGLWGVGHTISLFVAGILVIFLHFEISERLAQTLEFCVALMLIALGIDALRKLYRGGQVHWHTHHHGSVTHAHPHVHDSSAAHNVSKSLAEQTHHGLRIGARPLIVGMVHGMAGSGALMLLVLSTISSPAAGIAYILVFGAGSIGGMMLMSMMVGLPFHLTLNRFSKAEWWLRGAAGLFSLGFGSYMIYQIGFVEGLFFPGPPL